MVENNFNKKLADDIEKKGSSEDNKKIQDKTSNIETDKKPRCEKCSLFPKVTKEIDVASTNLPLWKIYNAGKVELRRGSGIWISEADLTFMTEITKHDPNEMIRKLLKYLIGEDTLSKSCATGNKDQSQVGIEPKVKNAVQEYVEKKTQQRMKTTTYHRVINLMCSLLARKNRHKKQNKVNKSSENNSECASNKNNIDEAGPEEKNHNKGRSSKKNNKENIKYRRVIWIVNRSKNKKIENSNKGMCRK